MVNVQPKVDGSSPLPVRVALVLSLSGASRPATTADYFPRPGVSPPSPPAAPRAVSRSLHPGDSGAADNGEEASCQSNQRRSGDGTIQQCFVFLCTSPAGSSESHCSLL